MRKGNKRNMEEKRNTENETENWKNSAKLVRNKQEKGMENREKQKRAIG